MRWTSNILLTEYHFDKQSCVFVLRYSSLCGQTRQQDVIDTVKYSIMVGKRRRKSVYFSLLLGSNPAQPPLSFTLIFHYYRTFMELFVNNVTPKDFILGMGGGRGGGLSPFPTKEKIIIVVVVIIIVK